MLTYADYGDWLALSTHCITLAIVVRKRVSIFHLHRFPAAYGQDLRERIDIYKVKAGSVFIFQPLIGSGRTTIPF